MGFLDVVTNTPILHVEYGTEHLDVETIMIVATLVLQGTCEGGVDFVGDCTIPTAVAPERLEVIRFAVGFVVWLLGVDRGLKPKGLF